MMYSMYVHEGKEQVMVLKISKWGNSQGIRLPKALIEKIHAVVGSTVKAEVSGGKIIIEPLSIPPKYDIHDLVKQIDPKRKQSELDCGKPEGNEIW